MIQWIYTSTPLAYFVQSFWRDEAFTYLLAKNNFLKILWLTARDFNPPLYYLILNIWMRMFGSSEIAIRSLSLVAFGLVFYIFVEFLHNVLNVKKQRVVLYSLLFFLNPILNYYAFEGRMYSLFTLFAGLSFYLLYKKKVREYVIVTTLGLYTHYFMIFAVLSQFVYVSLSSWHSRDKKQILKKMIRPLLLFAPWIFYAATCNVFFQSDFWILKPIFKKLLIIPAQIYTGYETELMFYNKYILLFSILTWTLFMLSLFILRSKFKSNDSVKLFLIWFSIPTFIVLSVSFWKPIFLPRYLIFASLGFILYIVVFLESVSKNSIRIVILLILLYATLHFNKLQVEMRKKSDFKKLSAEIKLLLKKNDLVYVENELDFHTAKYYIGESRVFIYKKPYGDIPAYVGKILIPEEKIAYSLPFYPKKAIVIDRNLHYTIEQAVR